MGFLLVVLFPTRRLGAAKKETGKVYDAVKTAVGPRVQVTNEFADSLRETLGKVAADVDVTPELKAPGNLKASCGVTSPDLAKVEGAPGTLRPGVMGTIEKMAAEQPVSRGRVAGDAIDTFEGPYQPANPPKMTDRASGHISSR